MSILTQKKPCSKCGENKTLDQFHKANRGKYGRSAECKACEAKRTNGDPDRLARMRNWRAENPDRMSRASRKWAAENPDKRKRSANQYRDKHPDRVRVSHHAYYEANKESESFRNLEWAKSHKESRVAAAEKRRAIKLNAPGRGITAKAIKEIKAAYHNICVYCGKKKPLTLDHIVPLISGGAHDDDNAAPACLSCNSSKQNKSLLIYLYERLIDGRD